MRIPKVLLAIAPVLMAALCASPANALQDPKRPGGGAGPGIDPGTIRTPRGNLQIAGRVEVGDVAPDFDLRSSRARNISLHKQRGDWVLLIFARQREAFDEVGVIAGEMAKLGTRMFGVIKDRSSALRGHAEKAGTPFELLADPTGDISAIYGLLDAERNSTRPGYVLVDRRGMVRLAVLGQSFPPEQVLALVRITIESL